jgi:hypothetical protein
MVSVDESLPVNWSVTLPLGSSPRSLRYPSAHGRNFCPSSSRPPVHRMSHIARSDHTYYTLFSRTSSMVSNNIFKSCLSSSNNFLPTLRVWMSVRPLSGKVGLSRQCIVKLTFQQFARHHRPIFRCGRQNRHRMFSNTITNCPLVLIPVQKAFQALLPGMIQVIGQCVEAANEEAARQLFDVLETLLILVSLITYS